MEESEDIYSDVDSEDFVQDMRSYGVAQALPLDVEGIDEDAAAYLRAVREEASRIPHVTASVRRYGEPEPPVHHDPHDTAVSQPPPMMDWIHSVVDGFVEARQQVHHQVEHGRPRTLDEAQVPFEQPVPGPNDRRAWQRRMQDNSFQPYADTLSQMDNNLASSCLCSLVDEVSNCCAPPPTPSQRHSPPDLSTAASPPFVGEALPPHLALWLYGLMVRLEQPVTPEVAAALRRVVTVAEAGLQRCKSQVGSNSQDSNTSSAECGGVADGEMMQEGPPITAAGMSDNSVDGASSPQLHQNVCDSASQAACAGSSDGEAALEGTVGMVEDVRAVVQGELSCSVCGADSMQCSCADSKVGNQSGNMRLYGGGLEESSCAGGGGAVVQNRGVVAQEVARCDTLRVLAGGFFGQDSTLAPLVHNYMRRVQVCCV